MGGHVVAMGGHVVAMGGHVVAMGGHEVAMGGHVVAMGGHVVARSSGVAESGRLVRCMSHRVDPAAIAEETRTVRLDAVLGPPRRSVPVGDSSTPESRTLTPLIMVRIQVPQPGSRVSGVLFPNV